MWGRLSQPIREAVVHSSTRADTSATAAAGTDAAARANTAARANAADSGTSTACAGTYDARCFGCCVAGRRHEVDRSFDGQCYQYPQQPRNSGRRAKGFGLHISPHGNAHIQFSRDVSDGAAALD